MMDDLEMSDGVYDNVLGLSDFGYNGLVRQCLLMPLSLSSASGYRVASVCAQERTLPLLCLRFHVMSIPNRNEDFTGLIVARCCQDRPNLQQRQRDEEAGNWMEVSRARNVDSESQ